MTSPDSVTVQDSPSLAVCATTKPKRRRLRGVPSYADGLLYIDEAAGRLRCSVKTVRKLVKSGTLPYVSYTRSRTEPLRFRALDIARYIESHTCRMSPDEKQH